MRGSSALGPGIAAADAGPSPNLDDLSLLAGRLADEFAAPVGLFDPIAGAWRVRVGAPEGRFPEPTGRPAAARADGVSVWRPVPTAGPAWLVLPAPRPDGPDLVAMAGFATEPEPVGTWGPPCPERALVAWGRAVADRLRREAGSRLLAHPGEGGEPSLTERLIHRLRVSDPPERFQRLAVGAAREALGVEAVAWVPCHGREPVVVAGSVAGLGDPEGFRTLVPEPLDAVVWVCNRRDGLGGVRRLAVVAAANDAPAGWLVAVNPADDRPFAGPEVALLQPVAALVGTQRNNARLYADLKDLLFGVVRALTAAIDAKDPYTSGHSERVARIAVRLGEELGLSPNQRGDLYLMGLLHDVGKIGIEDTVLKKPGKLSAEEYRQIQSHVRIGVHILSDLKKLSHLLPGVAHHHESLDGTGYPGGLAGEAIPLAARILAVADAFDAMSSSRPYRRRLTTDQIDDALRKGAGTQWDPKVVNALFDCRSDIDRIRQKGLGESLQRAVNGAIGRP